jgi:ABC-type lipoprotein export system ATPase subunit
VTPYVLELADVVKDYRGLRPLRIQRLTIASGEQVAIMGFDQPMAEMFVNLVTGATLPDHGEVKIFGHASSGIADSAEWLALLDRFGIVTDRAVLLDALTLIQNVAVPYTLDLEPLSDEIERRAGQLAREVGLQESQWDSPVANLEAAAQTRVRLARALALDPAVVLLEHPTSSVGRDEARPLGDHIRSLAQRRGAAIVALTADRSFANAVASRVLTHDAATGRLNERRGLISRFLDR